MSYEVDLYEMVTTVDSLKDYFQHKQLDGERVLDCARHFKVAREVSTSYLGGPSDLKKHARDQLERLEG